MPLASVLEKLYARRRFGIRPGVDRVETLLARLGNPEKRFQSIHVVGTNGKGSTSAFLSSILIKAGRRTAQFSSPHLLHFTERFRINGIEYSAGKLARALDTVLKAAPEEATFFEITTALAAYVFSDEGCEYAVMEAGMGGRSDATAALPAILTIVTPISIDHSEFLGTTLSEIAREKSGIFEPDTPVISAGQPEEAGAEIRKRCVSGHNRLLTCGVDFTAGWNDCGRLDYRGMGVRLNDLESGIRGRFQSGNAALALAAAEVLAETAGVITSVASLTDGVREAAWPGRMELIQGNPPLLLDGAHNPAGAAALAEAVTEEYPGVRILLVTGVCADKNFEQLYVPLLPLADKIFTVTPSIDRALTDRELAHYFERNGRSVQACGTVAGGIAAARLEALPGDMIVVCGSLFVVGETKAFLLHEPFEGVRG